MKRYGSFETGRTMSAWPMMFPHGSDGDLSLIKHRAALTALKPADRPAPAPLDVQACFGGTGTVGRDIPQFPPAS